VDVTPPAPQVIQGGHGTVVLRVTPNSFWGPETGAIRVLAGDEHGALSETEVTITAVMAHTTMDTLYAIPLNTRVRVGEPVRIVVVTSATANSFYYMTGVRVTIPTAAGVDYVYGRLNIGAPGGPREEPDGIWAELGVTNFISPDGLEFWIDTIDAGGGMTGIDFNLTPLGGQAVAGAEGALFSFEVTFAAAGNWQLGFQDVNILSRTYYNDENQFPDFYWSDISNDHPGVPNTITVVP
jgi:hypothetical protein